jgi:hypothetical protein
MIDDFCNRVLNWQHSHIERHALQQLAHHLKNVVQPQLDELAALKAEASDTKKKPRQAVSA